jgi:hypothetical protein
MIADAFYNGDGTTIANREALSSKSSEICFSVDGTE